jgi:hypothetical protein
VGTVPCELEPIITRVVYRPSLSRRLTALEKKMGIGPEERHQDDPLARAKDVYVTGVRLRNTPTAVDKKTMAQELPIDMPAKTTQGVLFFPVVKPASVAVKQVATPTVGALGVRMILGNQSVRL